MIGHKYSKDFESLWATFSGEFGAKGSKRVAETAYLALKCDKKDLAMIINAVIDQQFEKSTLRNMGIFSPAFQEVHRYLRNERYLDEPDQRTAIQKPLSRRDEAREAIYRLTGEAGTDSGGVEQIAKLRIVK